MYLYAYYALFRIKKQLIYIFMKENSTKSKECLKRQIAQLPIFNVCGWSLKLNDLPSSVNLQALTQEECDVKG